MPNEKAARGGAQARRLKLVVAYDGRDFSGWQLQPNSDTIQARLEAAFASVTGDEIRVHGAGRTDAGVHALGQCAHADLITRLDPAVLLSALNASLPASIRVMRCRFVAKSFHARFDARGKVYRYRIVTTPVLSPFELGRAWHVTGALDEAALRACTLQFLGRHNFAGFAANRGHPVESTMRTIRQARLHHTGGAIAIEFEGDGFLYKMMRLMVGAIVRCALGRTSLGEVRERLRHPVAASIERHRLVAPAEGLTLIRVQY